MDKEDQPQDDLNQPVNWAVIAVMANVRVKQRIGNNMIALVSMGDERLKAIKKTRPDWIDFIGRFKNAFGVAVTTTALIYRHEITKIESEAMATFRYVTAISVLTRRNTRKLCLGGFDHYLWSNHFDFYPVMPSNDPDWVYVDVPSYRALDASSAFDGQSSSDMAHACIDPDDVDWYLFETLMARWNECFYCNKQDWSNLALFRSLNMAYHAMRLPGGVETEIYDYGRCLSLWVSAFEILFHTGAGRGSSKEIVCNSLEKYKWVDERLNEKIANPFSNQSSQTKTLIAWLYSDLHKRRNDFLHGNELLKEPLHLTSDQPNVLQLAVPLYRLALSAFLDLDLAAIRNPRGASFSKDEYLVLEPHEVAERVLLRLFPKTVT